MDKIGADFKCVSMVKDRTGATPLPINLPIGAENNFAGLVDLVSMKSGFGIRRFGCFMDYL